LIGLLLTSCSPSVAELDALESAESLVKEAKDKEREGLREDAINLLTRALDNDPRLARAHLELALLIDDRGRENNVGNDFIRALYHYQRYLELRPETEKRELINNRVRLAKNSFSGSITVRPNTSRKVIDDLTAENQRLKGDLTRLQETVDQLSIELQSAKAELQAHEARPDTSAAVPDRATEVASNNQRVVPPEPPVNTTRNPGITFPATHVVKSGENLQKIAEKYYGDKNQWRHIYKENSSRIRNSNTLRIGQRIIIPPPPEE
jgi:LysM repeat protein